MNRTNKSIIWRIIEGILRWLLFDLLHLSFSDETWNGILQFIRFGVVGLSSTIISYLIYVLFLVIFQKNTLFQNIDYLIAQVIAFVLSVLWSFYWNKRFVFTADNGEIVWWKVLIKTYISYAFTGLILNSLLSIAWVQLIGIPKIIAPIFNLIISVPVNFILNKFWAFTK